MELLDGKTLKHFMEAKPLPLGMTSFGHEDGRRLDVAVNYSFGVGGVESIRDLNPQVQQLFPGGAAACPPPCRRHPCHRHRSSQGCGSARWSGRSLINA